MNVGGLEPKIWSSASVTGIQRYFRPLSWKQPWDFLFQHWFDCRQAELQNTHIKVSKYTCLQKSPGGEGGCSQPAVYDTGTVTPMYVCLYFFYQLYFPVQHKDGSGLRTSHCLLYIYLYIHMTYCIKERKNVSDSERSKSKLNGTYYPRWS